MFVFCPIPKRYLTQCFPHGGFSFWIGEACVLFTFGHLISLEAKSRRCHGGQCLTARFRDHALWEERDALAGGASSVA